ncbi:MAG: DUF559 domain-containing protein [Candidatus Magasanikbacteria bacterium]|nr:DUF559 domain-containing protein [Candidatus Magasanikbacteria bacterium]
MQQKYGRYTNKSSYTQKRKDLRNHSTDSEVKLWGRIKNEQLGVKFRRQFNISNFIVDFYCHPLKLVLELDGWVHDAEEQRKKDKIRELKLKSLGYTVIRYQNSDITYRLDWVVDNIWEIVEGLKKKECV